MTIFKEVRQRVNYELKNIFSIHCVHSNFRGNITINKCIGTYNINIKFKTESHFLLLTMVWHYQYIITKCHFLKI